MPERTRVTAGNLVGRAAAGGHLAVYAVAIWPRMHRVARRRTRTSACFLWETPPNEALRRLWRTEPGQGEVLPRVRRGAGSAVAAPRGAAGRHGALRRPRGLHQPQRADGR